MWLNPTIFHLGPLEIRWYGVMYVLAALFTYYFIRAHIKNGKAKFDENHLDDFILYSIIGLVVGARVFQFLFYDFKSFVEAPISILYVWKGGLSFFGGMIGVFLAAYYVCKKNKVNLWHFTDIAIVPLALAQVFGRIGNFINQELYGTVTNLPWGIIFPLDETGLPRHPNQLYEVGYDIIIFLVLYWRLRNNGNKNFALFMILYPTFRFLTEFLRYDKEVVIGPLSLSQWLCIPMFIVGVWLWRK